MALPPTQTPFYVTKPMLPHLVGKLVQVVDNSNMDNTDAKPKDKIETNENKTETKVKTKKTKAKTERNEETPKGDGNITDKESLDKMVVENSGENQEETDNNLPEVKVDNEMVQGQNKTEEKDDDIKHSEPNIAVENDKSEGKQDKEDTIEQIVVDCEQNNSKSENEEKQSNDKDCVIGVDEIIQSSDKTKIVSDKVTTEKVGEGELKNNLNIHKLEDTQDPKIKQDLISTGEADKGKKLITNGTTEQQMGIINEGDKDPTKSNETNMIKEEMDTKNCGNESKVYDKTNNEDIIKDKKTNVIPNKEEKKILDENNKEILKNLKEENKEHNLIKQEENCNAPLSGNNENKEPNSEAPQETVLASKDDPQKKEENGLKIRTEENIGDKVNATNTSYNEEKITDKIEHDKNIHTEEEQKKDENITNKMEENCAIVINGDKLILVNEENISKTNQTLIDDKKNKDITKIEAVKDKDTENANISKEEQGISVANQTSIDIKESQDVTSIQTDIEDQKNVNVEKNDTLKVTNEEVKSTTAAINMKGGNLNEMTKEEYEINVYHVEKVNSTKIPNEKNKDTENIYVDEMITNKDDSNIEKMELKDVKMITKEEEEDPTKMIDKQQESIINKLDGKKDTLKYEKEDNRDTPKIANLDEGNTPDTPLSTDVEKEDVTIKKNEEKTDISNVPTEEKDDVKNVIAEKLTAENIDNYVEENATNVIDKGQMDTGTVKGKEKADTLKITHIVVKPTDINTSEGIKENNNTTNESKQDEKKNDVSERQGSDIIDKNVINKRSIKKEYKAENTKTKKEKTKAKAKPMQTVETKVDNEEPKSVEKTVNPSAISTKDSKEEEAVAPSVDEQIEEEENSKESVGKKLNVENDMNPQDNEMEKDNGTIIIDGGSSLKDDSSSLIPDKSMQDNIKEAIRDIENQIDKEITIEENIVNTESGTPGLTNDNIIEENRLTFDENKEEKLPSKLTRKQSTKSQRRIDHRLGNKDNNRTFYITKLAADETTTTYPTISESSDFSRTPSENLTSILSNITITYQELSYGGPTFGKSEKIKIMKQKLANEKCLMQKF